MFREYRIWFIIFALIFITPIAIIQTIHALITYKRDDTENDRRQIRGEVLKG